MKKYLTILGLALGLTTTAFAQGPKLGHVDRQQLMLVLPERKDAETKMQKFAEELDKRLRAMATEYQQKVTEVQENAETMTQTEQDMAVREIQELEQRIQAAQEKAQEDLAKQEEELLRPMVDRTTKAIRDVASEGGYTYIFDTSAGFVLYWDAGEDILQAVKAKLGIQ